MDSFLDALDGIVGYEEVPEIQPVAFQVEPEVQPNQVTGRMLEQTESVKIPQPEPQSNPQPEAFDAITIPEPEIQSEPETQTVPESAATPAEGTIPMPETEPGLEQITEPTETASVPDSEPQPAAASDEDATTENQLTGEISTLWGDHVRLSADRRATAAELRKIRAELSERLYRAKAILSRPDAGRGGKWKSWLREMSIPRSTADRLVSRYAETLATENEKIPSGAISQPAEGNVEKLAKNTWQKIGKFLTTNESAFEFISRFAELAGVAHEQRDEGLVILKPVPKAPEDVPDSTAASVPIPQPSDCTSTDPEQPIADPNTLPPAEQAVSTAMTSSAMAA